MNELQFSDNILTLRRKKHITQEELATAIGVTKASVSKWETGATMPDILLLPLLASYFDVSVDDLLGYKPQLSREQIQKIYAQLAEAFANQPFAEVMPRCEELVKKYYSCYPFLFEMVILWLNHAACAPDKTVMMEVFEKTIRLCDHIIQESEQVELCSNAENLKSMLMLQCGRTEEVIENLEEEVMSVNHVEGKGALLTMAYLLAGQNEQGKKAAQIGMFRSLSELMGFGMYLLMLMKEDTAYCTELIHRLDDLQESFQLIKLHPNTAANYHYQVAAYLCEQDKKEISEKEIMERIGWYVQAVEQLVQDNFSLHGDAMFDKLDSWFSGLELGSGKVRNEKLIKESTVTSLQNPVFEKLRNKKKFQAYIKRLQQL